MALPDIASVKIFQSYEDRIESQIAGRENETLHSPLDTGYIPACMRQGFDLPGITPVKEIQIQSMGGRENEATMIQKIGEDDSAAEIFLKTYGIDAKEFGRPFGIDVSVFHPMMEGGLYKNYKEELGAGDDIRAVYITVDHSASHSMEMAVTCPEFSGETTEGHPVTVAATRIPVELTITTILVVKNDGQMEETGYLSLDGKMLEIIPNSGNGDDLLPMLGRYIDSESDLKTLPEAIPVINNMTDESRQKYMSVYESSIDRGLTEIKQKLYQQQKDKLETRKDTVKEFVESLRTAYEDSATDFQLVSARYLSMGAELRELKTVIHEKLAAYKETVDKGENADTLYDEIKSLYETYEERKADFAKELTHEQVVEKRENADQSEKKYNEVMTILDRVYDEEIDTADPKDEGKNNPLHFAMDVLQSNRAFRAEKFSNPSAPVSAETREKALAYMEKKVDAWNKGHDDVRLTLDKENVTVLDTERNRVYEVVDRSAYSDHTLDGLYDEVEAKDFEAELPEGFLEPKQTDVLVSETEHGTVTEEPFGNPGRHETDTAADVHSEKTVEKNNPGYLDRDVRPRIKTGVSIVDREGKVELSAEKKEKIRNEVLQEHKIDLKEYEQRVQAEKKEIQLTAEEKTDCRTRTVDGMLKGKARSTYNEIQKSVTDVVMHSSIRKEVYEKLGVNVADIDRVKAKQRDAMTPTAIMETNAEKNAKKLGLNKEQVESFKAYFLEQSMDWKAERSAMKEFGISLDQYRDVAASLTEGRQLTDEERETAAQTCRTLTGINEAEYKERYEKIQDEVKQAKAEAIVQKETSIDHKIEVKEQAAIAKLEKIKVQIGEKLDVRQEWAKALTPTWNSQNIFYKRPDWQLVLLSEEYKKAGGEIGDGQCVKEVLRKQERHEARMETGRCNPLGTLAAMFARVHYEKVDGVPEGAEKFRFRDVFKKSKSKEMVEAPENKKEEVTEEETKENKESVEATKPEVSVETDKPETKLNDKTEEPERVTYPHGAKEDVVTRTEQGTTIRYANGRILYDRMPQNGSTTLGEVTVRADGKRYAWEEMRTVTGENQYIFVKGVMEDRQMPKLTSGTAVIIRNVAGNTETIRRFEGSDEVEKVVTKQDTDTNGMKFTHIETVHGVGFKNGTIEKVEWQETKETIEDKNGYIVSENTVKTDSDGNKTETVIDNAEQKMLIQETSKEGKTTVYISEMTNVPDRAPVDTETQKDTLYSVAIQENSTEAKKWDKEIHETDSGTTVRYTIKEEYNSENGVTVRQQVVIETDKEGNPERRSDNVVTEKFIMEKDQETGEEKRSTVTTTDSWIYDKDDRLEKHTMTENQVDNEGKLQKSHEITYDTQGNIVSDIQREYWDNSTVVREETIQKNDQQVTNRYDMDGSLLERTESKMTDGFRQTVTRQTVTTDDAAIVAESESQQDDNPNNEDHVIVDDSEEEEGKTEQPLMNEKTKEKVINAITETVDGTVSGTDEVLSDMLDDLFYQSSSESEGPTRLFTEVLDAWKDVLHTKAEGTPDVSTSGVLNGLEDAAMTVFEKGLKYNAIGETTEWLTHNAKDLSAEVTAVLGEDVGQKFEEDLHQKYADLPSTQVVVPEYNGQTETDFRAVDDVPVNYDGLHDLVAKEMENRIEAAKNDLFVAEGKNDQEHRRADAVDSVAEQIRKIYPEIPQQDAMTVADDIVSARIVANERQEESVGPKPENFTPPTLYDPPTLNEINQALTDNGFLPLDPPQGDPMESISGAITSDSDPQPDVINEQDPTVQDVLRENQMPDNSIPEPVENGF